MSDELERLALGCLIAAFDGITLPAWMRDQIGAGLGGVILYARNIESRTQVAALTAALRAARDDILITTDEEGGDVTRLEALTGSSYPGNFALGRINDLALTQAVAASIAGDLAEVGINLDFAPVADVNSNPDNPIIGVRAFGDIPELAAAHVAAFVKGLQSHGVAACAKHFPGHGDTSVDSHRQLPTTDLSRDELAASLLPFRAAIEAGVEAIMTAHLLVPAYDTLPATLSRRILHDLLRGELGFDGLIVTDALDMRAISATLGREQASVQALVAGADSIILGGDVADDALVDRVAKVIVDAVQDGTLARERLADANARNRRTAARYPTAKPTTLARAGQDIGLEAARRALRVEGKIVTGKAPVVVELHPEPTAAVGVVPWGIGELVSRRDPSARVVRFDGPPVDLEQVSAAAAGRSLILVVRDLHRYGWAASAAAAIVAGHPGTVVVDMGLPRSVPGSAGYIATHGAGRANAVAAIEALFATQAAGTTSTEQVHARAADLHRLDSKTLLSLMHNEDRRAVEQVGQCIDAIAAAVEAITERLRRGGALHYFGAGTSGRLAALDAIECPATFGIAAEVVVPHVAATDADEDDLGLGAAEASAADLGDRDAVVGVSASGTTGYVQAALDHARSRGALTIALTCAPGSALGRMAELAIEVPTGPELVAGSTRLKAGTAQKIVLNMLSTTVFTRLGHVYRGRMVDMVPTNEKLRRRAAAIVRDLTGANATEVDNALAQAGGNAKLAVLMLQTGLSVEVARARLLEDQGDLSVALGESP